MLNLIMTVIVILFAFMFAFLLWWGRNINKTRNQRLLLIGLMRHPDYRSLDIGDALDSVDFTEHVDALNMFRDPGRLYPLWLQPKLRELWR